MTRSGAGSATPWVVTPLAEGVSAGPVEVRGTAWLEPTAHGLLPHRLPASARAQFPDAFVRMCDEQGSGVHLRLRTAARRIALDVRALRVAIPPNPPGAAGRYDVVVDGAVVARDETVVGQGTARECGVIELDPLRGTTTERPGPVTAVELPTLPGDGVRVRDVEIWLPYGETTRLVALCTDAPVEPPTPVRAPRWVHHGSSISHGASAADPTGIWPVVAARTAGLDLVNLGFSGNAVLDPFVARAIRDQPADLITLKLGINVVNHDCFRLRSFAPAVHGFLDTIREGHPTTPVVVISALLCPLVEDVPGPTSIDPHAPADAPVFRTHGSADEVADGRLTLGVIRRELAALVAARALSDPHLTYVDGRAWFGADDEDVRPMADLMHPGAVAHAEIGARAARYFVGPLREREGRRGL